MIINRIIQLMLVQLAAMQLVQHPRTLVWGTLGNTIAGVVGCFGGGQLLSALIPMMAGAGNNIGIGLLMRRHRRGSARLRFRLRA
jgi:hypothetical protein